MSKRVFITLLQTCMIAGLPRSPVEGVQEVDAGEAKRLVDAGMAEMADVGGDDADDDGLDGKTVKELRDLAKADEVKVESDANKAALIAAIRKHREDDAAAREALKTELDGLDGEKLAERATADEVTYAEGADAGVIREAIFAKHFPPAD